MNCKFCNNFIPDDAKVCSICGKSTDEEALVAVEETAVPAVAAETAAEAKPAKVYKKKSLKLPFIIILIAVAAFVYLFSPFSKLSLCAEYNKDINEENKITATDVIGEDGELSLEGGHDEKLKEEGNDLGWANFKTAAAANGAAGLVGLAGVALLGKRVSGNSKAKKQGN